MDGMTAPERIQTYVFVDVATQASALLREHRLGRFTERHVYQPDQAPALTAGQDIERLLGQSGAAGVIFALEHGAPGRTLLQQTARILKSGCQVFFYWPNEQAIEVVDNERLASFWRLWFFTRAYSRWRTWQDRRRAGAPVGASTLGATNAPAPAFANVHNAVSVNVENIVGDAQSLRTHNQGAVATLRELSKGYAANGQEVAAREMTGCADYVEGGLPVLDRIVSAATSIRESAGSIADTIGHAGYGAARSPLSPHDALAEARALISAAKPTPLSPPQAPTPQEPLGRLGMYARFDFWAPLTSGGSYGHTVYQAKALSRTTQDFACIVANPFRTLDTLNVRQVVLRPELREGNEANIVDANRFYYAQLRPLIEAARPAFIFERLVLGNYVIAKICRELAIPYIAEYNGSEISMMRSFNNGKGYEHEAFYLAAEEFAFKQATLVSVVSEHVGADVAARGVPKDRILVNPNAVELDAYAPGSAEEKQEIRAELGFNDSHRVIGFIGTFGGWHGVDVLAASMHKILARAPNARFLLIGDGNLKGLVREAVEKHELQDRVVDVGRVPQGEGARLLKACDVLVSPHSSHMVDSKFFGSPTKLFEYMAMSAGIVASDLEQIGEVLAPALRLSDVRAGNVSAGEHRALLCAPGDENEFVEATLALVNDSELSASLGKNARAAAERYYTWDQHVADLWAVLSGTERRGFHADLQAKGLEKP